MPPSKWFPDPRHGRLSALARDMLQSGLEGSVRPDVPVEYIIDQIQGDPGHEAFYHQLNSSGCHLLLKLTRQQHKMRWLHISEFVFYVE